MRLASQEQRRLPPPEEKRPAGRGGRASPLLAPRAGLPRPVPAAPQAAAATDHLGDPASQSTCCSDQVAARWLPLRRAGEMDFSGQLPGAAGESGPPLLLLLPPPALRGPPGDAGRGSPASGGATAAGCAVGCGAEDPPAAAGAGSVAGSPWERAPNPCARGSGGGGDGEGDRRAGEDRELGTQGRAGSPAAQSSRGARGGPPAGLGGDSCRGDGGRLSILPSAARPAGPCTASVGQVCTVWGQRPG